MTIMGELGALSPVWVVLGAAILVLLLTVASGRRAPAAATHLCIIALFGLGAAAWLLWRQAPESQSVFAGAVLVDGLSVIFGLTALLGSFVAILLSMAYLEEHELSAGEFIALVLLAVVGMLTVVMAGDLMVLIIGIEVMSLSAYVLAGYRRASRESQEAALKYFVVGAFASSFALFGVALLYGAVGATLGHPSLRLVQIAQAFGLGVGPLGWVGVALVLAGLAFKIAAVPFHMWAPDVYEGAPTPTSGFLAVGLKTAAFAALCRFVVATMLAGKSATESAIQVFELLAILSMVVGNLLAIRQTQLKRMLAYSSIAHAGYLLVGVAALLANPTSSALEAIAFYLIGYTVMTLGAFGLGVALERKSEARHDLPFDRLAGLGHRYPFLGLATVVFMLSLAGIPPTAGFFGKLAIFAVAVGAGRVGLVVVAVLASLLGAYYYLRVLVIMYMRAGGGDEVRVRSPWLAAALWLCVALTLLAGILPEGYLTLARRLLAGWLG
jgi:NADH-quinone oxidoreductase subunit N